MKIKTQADINECGLVIVQAFYHYFFKKWININDLKHQSHYTKTGINLDNLEKLASQFNLEANSLKGNWENLKQLKLDKPIAALINKSGFFHYIIITKIDQNLFYILDPVSGFETISHELMKKYFQNVIIIFSKKLNLQPIKTQNNFLGKNILGYLKNFETILILITVILDVAFLLLGSFFIKLIFNYVLINSNELLLLKIFLIFAINLVLKVINIIFKTYYLKKITIKIEKVIYKKFLKSFANIELNYLEKMDYKDNLRKINNIKSVSIFIGNFIFSLIGEFLLVIISLVMLTIINLVLFYVATGFIFVIAIFSFFQQKYLYKQYNASLIYQKDIFSANYSYINNLAKIKNLQNKKFYESIMYENFYNKNFFEYKLSLKENFLKNLTNFLMGFVPLVIIFVGFYLLFRNEISLSNILIFMTFFNFYLEPIKNFLQLFLNYPIFKKQYNELEFIFQSKKEIFTIKNHITSSINSIKFKNFTYSFDNSKAIFNIDNFEINSDVILKGANGSGKSTFLKCLALEKQVNSEKYFINGKALKNYNFAEIRKKIIIISPDEYLPEITPISFITKNNEQKLKTLETNLEKYDLVKKLLLKNLNLWVPIENNSQNFSSGQRQIILALQLLTEKYDLVILDEAFDNVDFETFQYLKLAINDFQNKSMFVEVSHNNKFIKNGEVINFENL
ncbi:Mbov_0121 family peptidase domain-containing ABC transporter [Candidatus Mycoplasma pogonae]